METVFRQLQFPWKLAALLAFFVTSHSTAGTIQEDLRLRLRLYSASPLEAVSGRKLHSVKAIAGFYRARDGRPAWTSVDTEALLATLREGWRDALAPEEYHLETIEKLFPDATETKDLFALEILLTDAFLTFGDHLFSGRVHPSELSADWAVRKRRIDMVKELESALAASTVSETLKQLTPRHARYRKLKSAFLKYRTIQEGGPFIEVPEEPTARQLRVRLHQEGFLGNLISSPDEFDDSLVKGLKAFQSARGIEPSGKMNAVTLVALNLPVEKLLRQIQANLERLRWLPPKFEDRYIFVDIANFRLVVFEGGRPTLSMRIIVGGDFRRTPMLDTKLTTIVLNPYWIIPKSILAEEILPRARKSPRYLLDQNIKVTEDWGGARREVEPDMIDWSRVKRDGSPYLFKQHSGPRNPLGNIKFILQNGFAVYLHGTPNIHLFEKEERTLSHGCIRVENPVALASLLLKDAAPPRSRAAIREAISNEVETAIPLKQSIPVHVWYRTAWVDEGGQLQFRKDTYGWDETLSDALDGLPPLIPKDLPLVLKGKRVRRPTRQLRRLGGLSGLR